MAIFTAIGTALGASAGAALATGAAVAGLGVTAYGTFKGIQAQKEQTALANQQATLQRRRSQMQNVRKAQVARARAMMSAVGSGSVNSSGAVGGIGSVQSQLGSALGYASQSSGIETMYNRAGARAANASAISSIGGSLFNLGVNNGGLNFLMRPSAGGAQSQASLDYLENR